jgi:ABC-type antimicrobial peptide transport system permease subunit
MVDIIVNVILNIIIFITLIFVVSWIIDLLTPKSEYNPLSKYETHKITNIKGKVFGFTSNDNKNITKKYNPIFNSHTECKNCKKYKPKDNYNFLDRYSQTSLQ